ncbi:mechanosensitive ion channel family protein [Actinomyces culturomici]|uniref:mechanosensitive ion channel family protein n=1 Tax=Actinomyces culturomici TaxID=1926276 RepID=UPI000E204139|nr:mechanosensitive ion channel domain-containing protein [Actinomyces culturomici]
MTPIDSALKALGFASATADSPQSAADAAVSDAFDIFSLLLGSVVGVVVGFVGAAVLSAVFKRLLRRWPVGSALVKRIRTPLYITLMSWGAWFGLEWMLQGADLSQWSNGALVSSVTHLILILAIGAMTGIAYAAAWVFEDAARLRQSADHGRARRFETQAQVIRRLIQVIVVIVGIVAILSTFAAARQAMATLLASAGLISVIAGLAAQQTLGNVFAGIQLAFTDAIRVGDVVVANQKGESGAIEEITLSYIVVRLWDERRLIVPSTYFTSTSFENWTRRAAAQLGTVEVQLDWAAPMALIRQKVEQILATTDLWDGRTWNVQMTASDTSTVTVRILVSAKNSGSLWDLRCYIREHLIAWIVAEEPWVRPASRIQPQEPVSVPKDTSRAEVAALAAELTRIAGDTSSSVSHEGEASALEAAAEVLSGDSADSEAVHAARMVAARRKAKRARRRAMADRMRDLADAHAPEAPGAPTQVMTRGTLERIVAGASGIPSFGGAASSIDEGAAGASSGGANGPAAPASSSAEGAPSSSATAVLPTVTSGGRGERLYSGSPDAEERSEIFAGPGEEALAEREAVAKRREAEAKGRQED